MNLASVCQIRKPNHSRLVSQSQGRRGLVDGRAAGRGRVDGRADGNGRQTGVSFLGGDYCHHR